jgi:hypothetical protein
LLISSGGARLVHRVVPSCPRAAGARLAVHRTRRVNAHLAPTGSGKTSRRFSGVSIGDVRQRRPPGAAALYVSLKALAVDANATAPRWPASRSSPKDAAIRT